MVRRELDDTEGPFYRLIPEGLIQDFDGAHIPIPRPEDGNLNRNYPADWAPESQTYGAGQHAASEPEIAATVRFIESHPNICGVLNYHTNAGCLLPPFSIEARRSRGKTPNCTSGSACWASGSPDTASWHPRRTSTSAVTHVVVAPRRPIYTAISG